MPLCREVIDKIELVQVRLTISYLPDQPQIKKWMQVERDREIEGSRQIEAEESFRSKRTTRDPSGPRQA